MGQKTNPIGLRVAVNKDWRSKWYAGKKEFGALLTEDRKIREILKKKLETASPRTVQTLSKNEIKTSNRMIASKLRRMRQSAQSKKG